MTKIESTCSSGSCGFKVERGQPITMADVEEHERNLKIAEKKKQNEG